MRVIGFLLAALALTTVCADQTFSIVENGGLNVLSLNISGEILPKPTINVTLGEKITFRIEKYLTFGDFIVPVGLSTAIGGSPSDFTSAAMGSLTPSASCVTNSSYLPFAYYVNQTTGEPCILTWTVVAPADGTQFYYTSRSATFAGAIEVQGLPTAGATTSAPTTNGTDPTPTANPTTAAPTQPTGSSTGKNSAAAIVPGAAAFIIAAINAIVA